MVAGSITLDRPVTLVAQDFQLWDPKVVKVVALLQTEDVRIDLADLVEEHVLAVLPQQSVLGRVRIH